MNGPAGPWAGLRRVFRLPVSRARLEQELAEEFRFHIEERTEQLMASGLSRVDADAEVRKRFGDYEAHWRLARQIDEDTMRQRQRSDFVHMLFREMQHSVRVLRRTPGFSFIAFLTLSLGIGATTAIYSVVDAVVLRPLPYPNADQLISVLHPATVPGNGERKWGLSAGGYFHFRNNNHTLSNLGVYRTSSATVTNGGTAAIARVSMVTGSVFATLGAKPEHGRLFIDADEVPGVPIVVVLSHEYFKRRFGSDVSIIGRNLETSGGTFQIVGVAEPGLTLPMPGPFSSQSNLSGFGVDVWMPLQLNPAGPFHNNHPYVGIARLKQGVTVDAAQRNLNTLFAQFSDLMPRAYSKGFIKEYNFRVEASPLKNSVLGPTVPRALWMVLGAVVLVLLIAAANVANLFIVRMEGRRRESAIRTALGADGAQMAAHYLSESLLLCGAAAIASVFLARVGLKALLAIAPTSIPRLNAVALSWTSVAVAGGIALVIGIVLGLLPFLRHVDIATLRDGGRGLSMSPRQRVVRSGLVVGQVALALVLLAAAGLMLRSFDHLRRVKPGLDATNVLVFDLSLPFTEYDTREKALAFHRALQERIKALPGVVSVGGTGGVPFEDFGTGCTVVFRELQPYAPDEDTPCVPAPNVLPGAFEALGIRVRGRLPTWADVDQRTQAVVITRALAQRLWPGQDVIGKGINSNGPNSKTWYRIVGEIDGLRAEALERTPTEAVFYAPTGFVPDERSGDVNDMGYLVRTNGIPPTSLTRRIAQLVAEGNPRVPFENVRTMEDILSRSMSRTTFIMLLLGVASVVALVLSAVGMYGVISYVVAQRRTEIGIRIALGATVSHVARMIVRQSVLLALAGIALGGVGAYASGQALTTLLFEVSPVDPVVLGVVALLLVLLAAAASLVPARRAAAIDPVEAMRAD